MEVHHHTHTERKKFTHYLWEFLMLFLAVFCGFLAEYRLEHMIEKERSKEYIRSFCSDLVKDTAEFALLIADREEKIQALENRKSCYDSIKKNIKSDGCLAALFNSSRAFRDFIPADQTILQLKNSGGFRLLKTEDADSILEYDKLVRKSIKGETTGMQSAQDEIRDLIYSLNNPNRFFITEEQKKTTPVLMTGNRELIGRYFNLLQNYFVSCKEGLRQSKKLKIKATELISFFKKKYHFKN